MSASILTVILICLNDGTEAQRSGNALIDRLSIVFSERLTAAEKKEILKNRYHVQLSREVEERSAEMTGSGALIREDAYRQGCEDGRAQGQSEGMSQGFTQGRRKTFFELVAAGMLSLKDAAEMLQMTEETFRAAAKDSGFPLS